MVLKTVQGMAKHLALVTVEAMVSVSALRMDWGSVLVWALAREREWVGREEESLGGSWALGTVWGHKRTTAHRSLPRFQPLQPPASMFLPRAHRRITGYTQSQFLEWQVH
jgi:hypothetical protein